MTDKVLGFKERQQKKQTLIETYFKGKEHGKKEFLEALQKWCKENESKWWATQRPYKAVKTNASLVNASMLLAWAEKEVGK